MAESSINFKYSVGSLLVLLFVVLASATTSAPPATNNNGPPYGIDGKQVAERKSVVLNLSIIFEL